MPPAVTQFWAKLNANEKLVMYGVIVIAVGFLVGVASGGFGTGSYSLFAAIGVTVIYWLKYSPNKINWPAPLPTIVLVIAGIAAVFALLAALSWISFLGFGLYGLAIILNAVGALLMAYGAWKEYQAMPKTAAPPPPADPTATTPPAPPAA